MDAAISVPRTLQNGFWPSSRFAPTIEDEYMDDGIVHEEYAKDALFVGRRHDCPLPSFRVDYDIYAGYFLAVRSTNGNLHPFWVARVVQTQTRILVTAIRFRFSIRDPIPFSTLMQTRM